MSAGERKVTNTVAAWLRAVPENGPGWGPEDWQVLKKVVRVHGVGPLLHLRLEKAEWLPVEMRLWLAEQHRYNRDRAARFHTDLQAILSAFGRHKMAVMPLKGSLLSMLYYPDAALRPMADLDFLVRPADRRAAESLLEQLGYKRLSANWKHTEWGRPGNLEVVSREFEHPDNPRKIDLHVSVSEMLGGPRIDITAQLWQRAVPGLLMGEQAMLPHQEDLWLHLLLHVNGEIWGLTNRLLHLYDLVLLTRPVELPPVDPRFVHLALRQLQETFPHPNQAAMLARSEISLPAGFTAWAEGFDLFSSSYLGRESAVPYFDRLRGFYSGRPGDLVAALRYILLPQREEVRFAAGDNAGWIHVSAAWMRILEEKINMIARLLA